MSDVKITTYDGPAIVAAAVATTVTVINGGGSGAPGAPGETGPAGPVGPAGSDGALGPKGDPGATGPKGDKGDAGAAGADGAAGPTGPTGATGAKGDKGDTGATGATGSAGSTGATGPAGVVAATAPVTYNSGTQTVGVTTGTTANTLAAGDDSRITGAAQKSANLSDLTDAPTARTNLGLGSAATVNTGTASGNVPLLSTGGTLPVARLATGTPDGTKFVRDDGTLATPAGGTAGGLAATSLPTKAIIGSTGTDTPVTGTPTFTWQGGTNVASGVVAFTFPTAFPNGVVTVVAVNGDGSANAGFVNVRTVTKTGFTTSSSVAGSYRFNWFAVGF